MILFINKLKYDNKILLKIRNDLRMNKFHDQINDIDF